MRRRRPRTRVRTKPLPLSGRCLARRVLSPAVAFPTRCSPPRAPRRLGPFRRRPPPPARPRYKAPRPRPWRNIALVGLVRGYFDGAGDRSGATAQTVGGFVAPAASWRKFSRDWLKALNAEGVSVFHMTDLMAGAGAFADWRGDARRKQRVLQQLVSIIRRHVHFAAASTVLLEDWNALNEQYAMKECHVSPFGLASFSVINKCILWCGRNRPEDEFLPVFEKGDADRGDRDHLVSWVRALGKPVLDSIRVDEESKSCPPLQAADLAAWEHRYTVAAVATGTLNEISASMKELLRLESSYGVIKEAELAEHRARLCIPERSVWSSWTQKQRASWRPAAFRSGTLYPSGPSVAE